MYRFLTLTRSGVGEALALDGAFAVQERASLGPVFPSLAVVSRRFVKDDTLELGTNHAKSKGGPRNLLTSSPEE